MIVFNVTQLSKAESLVTGQTREVTLYQRTEIYLFLVLQKIVYPIESSCS